MSGRALDNPLVVPILGLLLEGPKHPYEVWRELAGPGRDPTVAVNRASVYDLVKALAAENWIAVHGTARAGNRPTRTVYALTPAGHDELVRRLDEQLRTPRREFPQFLTAVGYVGALGPEAAVAALTERAAALRARIAEDEARLAAARRRVPELFVIEADYALHMVRSELVWVDDLIRRIRTGGLAWPESGDRP
ncbi:MAG TPA: PadR family transcriptional regulator [Acidimicrobiales bacterium]